jgi:hypothetical protein
MEYGLVNFCPPALRGMFSVGVDLASERYLLESPAYFSEMHQLLCISQDDSVVFVESCNGIAGL